MTKGFFLVTPGLDELRVLLSGFSFFSTVPFSWVDPTEGIPAKPFNVLRDI